MISSLLWSLDEQSENSQPNTSFEKAPASYRAIQALRGQARNVRQESCGVLLWGVGAERPKGAKNIQTSVMKEAESQTHPFSPFSTLFRLFFVQTFGPPGLQGPRRLFKISNTTYSQVSQSVAAAKLCARVSCAWIGSIQKAPSGKGSLKIHLKFS